MAEWPRASVDVNVVVDEAMWDASHGDYVEYVTMLREAGRVGPLIREDMYHHLQDYSGLSAEGREWLNNFLSNY